MKDSIYTQEMVDNIELPKVGMRCIIKGRDDNSKLNAEYRIKYISLMHIIATFEDGDTEKEEHFNFSKVKCYPIKSKQEIAEDEQIDKLRAFYNKITKMHLTVRHAKQLQSAGLLREIKE